MKSSLIKLRIKYCVVASAVVLCVTALMIVTLNIMMRVSYRNEEAMLESVISQAAESHINQPNSEYFNLIEAEKTDNGECIIPRNIKDIANITVYGSISCADKGAIWYSAGGGLIFSVEIDGEPVNVYKDYTFNRGTTNVSIDFTSLDDVKRDYETISVNESQVLNDYFLVSGTWWNNSSSVPTGQDPNTKLTIDSIEIHYKQSRVISAATHSLVSHSSFSDIFENNVPAVLNNTGAFYLITDSEGRLVSVNDGNLLKAITNDEARDYASKVLEADRDSGKIRRDGVSYSYTVSRTDDMNILIFVNDSFTDNANGSLLRISLLVGFMVWVLLTLIVIIVSGTLIKPVGKNIELQNQFISNASHELKTPITVISATIDIISQKKGSDRWTDCIKEQVRKMQTLVSELLDLSRMVEIRAARSAFKVCDISSIVSNSLLYFESLFFESGKTLRQDIEPNISIRCDETKISRLTGILTDNALKYSDPASEIMFSLCREKDNVVIRCSNKCSDFSAVDINRLFERFYRSDNDRIHEQEGFGLGLSIAQAITQVHNGTISADYKEGVITFTAVLSRT